MNNSTFGPSLGEAVMLMRNLLGHSAQIGMGIVGALGQGSSKALCAAVQGRTPLGLGCDTCDVPPPCWEPQPLGQVTSFVAAGGQATIRFRVTNCGFSPRTITFASIKPLPGLTFSPTSLTLGPLERGVVSASLQIAATAKQGEEHELVLLVHGCKNYYLRWVIKVAACGVDMCNEVEVNDCPDMIHHWYDHFYCRRHCQDQRIPGIGGINPGGKPPAPTLNTQGTIK
jgi:hypothetical protein